jgi:catabolite regulation protein CreA
LNVLEAAVFMNKVMIVWGRERINKLKKAAKKSFVYVYHGTKISADTTYQRIKGITLNGSPKIVLLEARQLQH